MLQRDYIMRLIREFFAALQRLLEKKEVSDRREELVKLYEQYVGPHAFYFTATTEELMQAVGDMPEQERVYKAEMLAELYNAEADMVSATDTDRLLRNAYVLFRYVEQESKTYNPRIREMIRKLEG